MTDGNIGYGIYKKVYPGRIHLTKKAYNIVGAGKAFESLFGQPKKGSTIANIRRKRPPGM